MSTYQGSLIHEDYHKMVDKKYIRSNSFKNNQIQPSSIDLTLGEEGYEINASFLSPYKNVKEELKDIMIKWDCCNLKS